MTTRTMKPQKMPERVDAFAGDIERLLIDLSREHELLIASMARHRRAISTANPGEIGACIAEHAAIAERIAHLDNTRDRLLARCAGHARQPSTPPTITDLASTLSEPSRSRILEHAGSLKTILLRVHAEQRVVRAAAESLATHMDGLMRQITRKLSHSGTYSPPARAGASVAPPPVVTSLDLRS
jgi:hypothetical protein